VLIREQPAVAAIAQHFEELIRCGVLAFSNELSHLIGAPTEGRARFLPLRK